MSGRMNWDRVRKENLSRARGSEWDDRFEDSQVISRKLVKKKKKKPSGKMKTCPRCGMRSRGMTFHSERCIYFPGKPRPKIVSGGLFESNRQRH